VTLGDLELDDFAEAMSGHSLAGGRQSDVISSSSMKRFHRSGSRTAFRGKGTFDMRGAICEGDERGEMRATASCAGAQRVVWEESVFALALQVYNP
jgi:hypothetical protein